VTALPFSARRAYWRWHYNRLSYREKRKRLKRRWMFRTLLPKRAS
jgi:hypothetical protein